MKKEKGGGKESNKRKKGFQLDAAQREMEGCHENSKCSQLNWKPQGERRISGDGDKAESNEKR